MELGGNEEEVYANYKAPQATVTMGRNFSTDQRKSHSSSTGPAGEKRGGRNRRSANNPDVVSPPAPASPPKPEKQSSPTETKKPTLPPIPEEAATLQKSKSGSSISRKSLVGVTKGIAATAKLSKLTREEIRKDSFEDIVGVDELEKLVHCFTVKKDRESIDVETALPLMEGSNEPKVVHEAMHRCLNEEEFVEEVHKVLDSQSKEEIRLWFRRIDADGTNEVGWEEFSTFLLSHGQKKNESDFRTAEYTRTCVPRSCPAYNQHEEHITSLLVHPKTGRIFTGSRDGSLRMWDGETLKHIKLCYTGDSWITAMTFTKGETRILVTTLDRGFHIFDAKTCEMLRTYIGRKIIDDENGLNYAVDSIPVVSVGRNSEGYMAPKTARVHARGGSTKSVKAAQLQTLSFEEYKALMEEDRIRRSEKKKLEQFTLADLVDVPTCMEYIIQDGDETAIFGMRKGHLRLYKIPTTQMRVVRGSHIVKVHDKPINMIRIAEHLDAILSCSDDGTIKLTSLQTLTVTKTFHPHASRVGESADAVPIGVHSVECSAVAKIFISCGHDRQPLVWDHLQENPVFHLEEHPAPLLACAMNENDGHIITASVDNCVKVFDWRSYRCIQVIHERLRARDNLFSKVAFDTNRHRIICCSTWPSAYNLRRKTAEFPPHYNGHTTTIQGSLFNPNNGQLVSFDNEFVNVWVADTGKLQFHFCLSSFSGVNGEYRLTSFSYDDLCRRVITGFHQGTIVIWNPSNGQALNIIRDPDSMAEVNSVISMQRKGQTFYIAAVGRRLLIAKEAQQFTITNVTRWVAPPECGAVLCICRVTEHLFACGTDAGCVFFFHLMSEKIDGNLLWVSQYDAEAKLSGTKTLSPTALLAMDATAGSGSVKLDASRVSPSSQSEDNLDNTSARTVLKVEKLIKMNNSMIVSCHSDGRIAFWHTIRRKFCGVIPLATRTNTIVSNITLDDQRFDFLAHTDELSNVHVWKLVLQPVEEDLSATLGQTTSSSFPLHDISSSHIHAQFNAHTKPITSLTFVRLVTPCIAVGCTDAHLKLFTVEGACVGSFGMGLWKLGDSVTWIHNRPAPLMLIGSESKTAENDELISATLKGKQAKSQQALLRRLSHVGSMSSEDEEEAAVARGPSLSPGHSPRFSPSKSLNMPGFGPLDTDAIPLYSPKSISSPSHKAVRPNTQPSGRFVRGVLVSSGSPGGKLGTRSLEGVLRRPPPQPQPQDSMIMSVKHSLLSDARQFGSFGHLPEALASTLHQSSTQTMRRPSAAETDFVSAIASLNHTETVEEGEMASDSSDSQSNSSRASSRCTTASVAEDDPCEQLVHRQAPKKLELMLGEEHRASALKHHLEIQEFRIRETRGSMFGEEMNKAVAKLNAKSRATKSGRSLAQGMGGGLPVLNSAKSRTTSTSVALVASQETQQLIGGLDNWTDRVATLIDTHDLDEIGPPKGSRAYQEEQRRGFKRHNVFSKPSKQKMPHTARH